MEVTIRVPDELAQRLSTAGDVSRQILEAFALEGYRSNSLTLLEVSELLGFGRVETEDFLGQHEVPLAEIDEVDLDRDAAVLRSLIRRRPR
jgi:predicted HTH domain antitoxin